MIRLLLLISLLLLLGLVSSAQSVGLKGIVTDPMGSLVPNVRVHLLSTESRSFWALTNDYGEYEIKIEPGKYHLSLIAVGFKPFEVNDFVVTADKTARFDIVLKPQSDERIDENLFLPDPMEFVLQKPDLSLEPVRRPLQGMSRYCGTVKDEVGGALPDVHVSLIPEKQSKAGKPYELKTDTDGKFDSLVIDGVYKVTFRREAFKKVVLRNQPLPSDPNSCSEIKLKSSVPRHQIT